MLDPFILSASCFSIVNTEVALQAHALEADVGVHPESPPGTTTDQGWESKGTQGDFSLDNAVFDIRFLLISFF